jgi:hypothetical protein
MPVSKHRRRSKTRTRKPDPSPEASRETSLTIEELRRAVANPALDFPAKTIVAGVWWFQQLLWKVGDNWRSSKASRKDKKTAAMLLCVAMDGEQGKNDDLSPVIAEMLRPYCPGPSFVEAWEHAKQMSPGTLRTQVAGILSPPGKPAG